MATFAADGEPRGLGLGFRFPHAGEILRDLPDIPWFEVIADDLMVSSGRYEVVEKLRHHYPLALHCVGMNLGGVDALDEDYIRQLAGLSERLQPGWVSDHLCWSANAQRQHFDLLPMPFTRHQLDHVAARVERAQELLTRPLVLENISYYVRFDADEMSEWEFHAELCRRTGCAVLLDLNNLWTNAVNFGLDPQREYQLAINTLDASTIRQLHLAGSTLQPGVNPHWIDAHSASVTDPVIALFQQFSATHPHVPSIIERDSAIPAFIEMKQERDSVHAALG